MVELMGLQQAQWTGWKSSISSMIGLVMPSTQIRTYLTKGGEWSQRGVKYSKGRSRDETEE